MAESIVGDLTPYDGVDKAEKHRREEVRIETTITITIILLKDYWAIV